MKIFAVLSVLGAAFALTKVRSRFVPQRVSGATRMMSDRDAGNQMASDHVERNEDVFARIRSVKKSWGKEKDLGDHISKKKNHIKGDKDIAGSQLFDKMMVVFLLAPFPASASELALNNEALGSSTSVALSSADEAIQLMYGYQTQIPDNVTWTILLVGGYILYFEFYKWLASW